MGDKARRGAVDHVYCTGIDNAADAFMNHTDGEVVVPVAIEVSGSQRPTEGIRVLRHVLHKGGVLVPPLVRDESRRQAARGTVDDVHGSFR